ncbi:MAG: TetR/AcrR family transcriptional regulator, partial [Nevskiales bacterium]
MPASPRSSRDERIAEILQVARELFSEKGYEHCSVAEIAARIGVVEGTVYKYFDSKRELLQTVLTEWYEGLHDDYADELSGVHGARARLQLLVWRHLRTLRDYPDLCRLTFNEFRVERDYH